MRSPDRHAFDYVEAFSRTLGWVTEIELQRLRRKRIAIAGVGGVGGVHLLTLARLGIGAFNIADLDIFEQANFNRQAGAMMSTIGKPKAEVMAAMARDINPELDIRIFPQGVGPENYDDFLRDVDLYVDGLDFFVFHVRAGMFAACHRLGIPAITVAPLGMGAALVNFLPGRMSFEEYFGFAGATDADKAVRFMVGLAPRAPHGRYLVDRTRLDLANQRGPSTPMACQLCAGVAATEALKILLGRGKVYAAPHAIAYDAYLNKLVRTWRPGGYRNPLNRLLAAAAKRMVSRAMAKRAAPPISGAHGATPMERILDTGRWAQSGDNVQPWRFEIRSENRLLVRLRRHLFGNRPDIYDYDDHSSLIALGCLAESLRLGASNFGWGMDWRFAPGADVHAVGTLEVDFDPQARVPAEPLAAFVPLRSVDRRRYRLQPLAPGQKQALEASLGPEFFLTWLESGAERWRMARLASLACDIRLSIPETAEIHQSIVDWDNAYSPDRVPALSVSVNAATRRLMRWALADIRRMTMLGRIPGSTLSSQLEMEILPGMFSAGYFLLLRRDSASGTREEVIIRAGEALQRFWLTATSLGLAIQPSFAIMSFAHYGRTETPFSSMASAMPRARRLAARLDRLYAEHGARPEDVMFLGRIGTPQQRLLTARSIRRPLDELIAP